METGAVARRGLERAVEWLRPLIEDHGWDYCVVWKLGDDPSRFIEFMDCCCAGGYVTETMEEAESGDRIGGMEICRDVRIEHRVRALGCKFLAQVPAFMSLYSGMHSEVAMSNEPKWLCEADRTMVLIPLGGGLIELYAAKMVPGDQTVLDSILYQHKVTLEHDVMAIDNCFKSSPEALEEIVQEPELGPYLQNSSSSVLYVDSKPRMQLAAPLKRPPTNASFPGSSTGSNPSNENPSFETGSGLISHDASLPGSLSNSPCSKKPKCSRIFPMPQAAMDSDQGDEVAAKANPKAGPKPGKEGWKAKNLDIERKRRTRIKELEFQLRALVPKISKMDRASIITDAIKYIMELKETQEQLEKELENEDYVEAAEVIQRPVIKPKKCVSSSDHSTKNPEVQVGVHQISARNFWLKFEADRQLCGFSRLMEALSSRSLHVESASVSTCHGVVVSNFHVEADGELQPDLLRKSLMEELVEKLKAKC